MNKSILTGRLTRDPDVRYSSGADPVCVARFTLAVDRPIKREGEQSADFISCVAFGKKGQFVENYCKQGKKFNVCGHIQTGSYTKQGVKVYTTDVVVDEIEFGESKKDQSEAQTDAPVETPDFIDVPDGFSEDGLPFN